jgi:hypothetical protein
MTTSKNTISTQVRELQYLAPDQLAARYQALFGKPPRVRNRAFLQRQVAWKLQEQQLGGINERARSRLDELTAQIDLTLGQPAAPRKRLPMRPDPKTPMVGTTLVREWRGQQLRVEVRDDGFTWDGAPYKSLSAVAKAITGAAWNGRLFFGLTQRRVSE